MKIQPIKTQIVLFILLAISFYSIPPDILAQQITIPRIEQMPNMPQPYEMRDWKQVTLGYDSLVFDFNRTGQYLPLIWMDANAVNYPEHNRFGLHTVVGTPHPKGAEAINILPAVISASLVDIDKNNQDGNNWVLMCEEFFQNRPKENVYLNNFIKSSGVDWWYDTMPNVFFYQLYDMYPNTGDFKRQFSTVADRWLEAVMKMGGSTAPWHRPYMNYRAWALSTMTPLATGVTEPEAAGAIAWLLYNAYIETSESKYRIGAEWCMEFLSNWQKNPSYELQLPYGTYIAARMNAELGTLYDVEKMVNRCFDPENNIRTWGATLGNWGGYDCYGLIGEAKYDGYAFIMNGFEQAGALVPMIRYDDRFARAIGKWMLNIANATRLFYPNYLPGENQDGEAWSYQYDPYSYIAHESMREFALNTGISPYATGDFVKNGWAPTNLVLYGSSHVGIFGGIIDTTNVKMILRLNVLKTDYFGDDAYSTYLYFNPYDEEKMVELDVGNGQYDLYEAVSNDFLQTNASGLTSFPIPGDAAVLLVVVPAGGTVTYELDKMLIDGIIVDYHSGQPVANYPPRIKSLAAAEDTILFGEKTKLYCTAADRDNNNLTYIWSVSGGTIAGNNSQIDWTAPDSAGMYNITCIVDDGKGGQDTAEASIEVLQYVNNPPFISAITAEPKKLDLEATSVLTCIAGDPDENELAFTWNSNAGRLTGEGSSVKWIAPSSQGHYFITCTVDDGHGGQVVDSIGVIVLDFSNIGTGLPIAYYPFNGNANDESGFEHHGTIFGATLEEDRFGNAESAYYFDGVNDFIRVRNHPELNFKEEITVSFWMKIAEFYSREAYPLSHGNWERRWKISITNKRIRWTVKTEKGIKDLDSEIQLVKDVFYNVTVVYDGSNFEIYINGDLDNRSTFSGLILTTDIDFTIGQVLPNNPNYNFKGVLDDVRIYNYALSNEEIQNIYNEKTSIKERYFECVPKLNRLHQNYPNPFNTQTSIRYQLKKAGHVSIGIYDILGRQVRILVDSEQLAGYHSLLWDGRNDRGEYVASGIYLYQMKIGDFCEKRKFVMLK